jgi:hypothetical protein
MEKKYSIILLIVGVLLLFRLFLPAIVLKLANRELASMEGYYGQIRDIDISLYRGAYVIDSIYINRLDTVKNTQTPFISAKAIDLSVEWRSLLHGRLVGEIEFLQPTLLFTKDKAELNQVKKDTNDFRKVLKSFMPLMINRFEITNGILAYQDHTSNPKVDISLDSAFIVASNLSSVEDTSLLPSKVTAKAKIYGGIMNLNMKLDALSESALFDMNVEVENTHLPELNDFFMAYANIDVNKGEFNLYAELATKNGKFTGYVKPVIKDLDVVGPEDRDDNFAEKVWEGFVGLLGVIVKNRKKEQVATIIPLKGEFGDAKVGVMTAVAELLRNAFIEALYPSIEHQISLTSVDKANEDRPGLLKRIFGKDRKDNDEKSK